MAEWKCKPCPNLTLYQIHCYMSKIKLESMTWCIYFLYVPVWCSFLCICLAGLGKLNNNKYFIEFSLCSAILHCQHLHWYSWFFFASCHFLNVYILQYLSHNLANIKQNETCFFFLLLKFMSFKILQLAHLL